MSRVGERDVQTIYTEDVSSGMGHVRLIVDGSAMSHEADNLDDAGAYREITYEEFIAKPRELRCLRCAPEADE